MVRRLAAISLMVDGAYSDFRQRRHATGMTWLTAGWSRTSGAKASSTSQVKAVSGRALRASINGRHMMNHIAERRCLDEKDVGHGAFVALIYRSLSMAAITMPSGGAIKTQFLLSAGTLPHAQGAIGMTVLVTGGAGYIGSHMVHELADAGEPVVVLDNLSTGFRFLIPTSVPFVAGSTGDRPLVGEVIAHHRVSAIIHFAASIVVPESVTDPLGYYSNNTMNTCALLDVAIKAGVREFIFSSTAAVYGNAE